MASLHPDLLLLAAVAQAYGVGVVAENCYALAQASTHLTPPMEVGDIEIGLGLMGLDPYRIVAPGLAVPDIIWDAIAYGHVTLAQVRGYPLRKRDYWCALTGPSNDGWIGLAITNDWGQCMISSQLGSTLVGHFIVVAQVLPDWDLTIIPS